MGRGVNTGALSPVGGIGGNTNASKPAKNSGVQRFRETDGHGAIRMIEEIGD